MTQENKSIFEKEYELQKRDADQEKGPPMEIGEYKLGEYKLFRRKLGKRNIQQIELREDGSWTDTTICIDQKQCEEIKLDIQIIPNAKLAETSNP